MPPKEASEPTAAASAAPEASSKAAAPSTAKANAADAPGGGETAVPRIGALEHDTYILAAPKAGSPEIGALDIGGIAVLRKPEPVSRAGCPGGWYEVQPEGFLCNDRNTTLDVDGHPLMVAKRDHHGQFDKGAIYRWGESKYAPIYRRVPSQEEQRRWEPRLDHHLAKLEALREARKAGASQDEIRTPPELEGVDIFPARNEVPPFLVNNAASPWSVVQTPLDGRPRYDMIPMRSTIAWTTEFFAEGRSWLMTPQLLLVPKDRIALREPSTFAGVFIDGDKVQLPLAFMRGEEKPKYKLEDAKPHRAEEAPEGAVVPAAWTPGAPFAEDPYDSPNNFVQTGETWKRLEWVGLTGRARLRRGKRFLETREPGIWIREDDATEVRGRDPRGLDLKDGEKWIDVSIHRGTLVAYEGTRPVFATLISPGLKGYSRVNGKPAKNTTPVGTFRIEWKHVSTTMSPDPEKNTYYLSEVPFTQFFHMPFALHGEYWHDRFGEPKSGGCVNLSVEDSRWLFDWTEPRVPEGWHSVRSGDDRGEGTWVVVR